MAPSEDQPPKHSANRADSFRHAFAGWAHMLRTQPNTWIHAAFTAAAIVVSAWLRLSTVEWALIVFAIGLVWTAEAINTALEAAVDLASPAIHPLAKISKDASAAGVLAAAITAVVIGLLVLGPPLYAKMWPLISGAGTP